MHSLITLHGHLYSALQRISDVHDECKRHLRNSGAIEVYDITLHSTIIKLLTSDHELFQYHRLLLFAVKWGRGRKRGVEAVLPSGEGY